MDNQFQFSAGERIIERPKWVYWLLPFLLVVLGFGTRLVAVGRYITPDEPTWVYRSVEFREALLHADWSGTLVAGHPGVITTWLGAIGMTAQMLLSPESKEAYEWLTHIAYLTPDNVEAFKRLGTLLTGGRVAVALVNSLGIALIYLLVKRLWGRPAAIVSGLFLAFDPFLAGLSGLLHVDGLSATFVTLSLLATAVWLREFGAGKRAIVWPALGGIAAGLAALTKTPTLLLIPVTGIAFLWPLVSYRELQFRDRLLAALSFALVWGVAFLMTVVILFPAIWASPEIVLATLGGSANRHLDEALRQTFFLGEAAFVHGPIFYPVVMLWRLSPVVWLALVAVVMYLLSHRPVVSRSSRKLSPAYLLLFWAVIFIIAITPAAKKFDRYILPIVPSLLIVAALGWTRLRGPRQGIGRWAVPIIVMVQLVYWIVFAAYPLTAYNPLVGGPWTAVRMLPIGWGESVSASGTYLSATQENVVEKRAIAGIAPSLAPFFAGTTLVYGYSDPAAADFVVVTQGGRQLDPVEFEAQTQGLNLIHTEHFGGLDQAWVFQQRSPSSPDDPDQLPEPAIFENRMALTAYGQTVEGDTVSVMARWRRLVTLADDERFTLRIVIGDEYGSIWAAQETDLLNEDYFYPPDWIDEDTGVVRYLLELPPGMPPGNYSVGLSLIDNRTSAQMPVRMGGGANQGVVYDAGDIVVSPLESIVSASRMQIPNAAGASWFEGDLQLLGFGDIPAEALAGSQLPVELFWHAPQTTLPPGLMVSWHLIGADGTNRVLATTPLSRYDTGMWRLGESIHEKYQVPLPPELTPGRYEIAVSAHETGESESPPATLGTIRINNIDRSYTLPEDIPVPLNVIWEPLTLSGMGPEELRGAPGQTIDLTLFWEKRIPHGAVYSVFVHVVDEAGNIVLQADHWPGGLPTDILNAGQVITDSVPLALPADMLPGVYSIRVGLYSAEDGQRLPITGGADASASGTADSFILPVPLFVQP